MKSYMDSRLDALVVRMQGMLNEAHDAVAANTKTLTQSASNESVDTQVTLDELNEPSVSMHGLLKEAIGVFFGLQMAFVRLFFSIWLLSVMVSFEGAIFTVVTSFKVGMAWWYRNEIETNNR